MKKIKILAAICFVTVFAVLGGCGGGGCGDGVYGSNCPSPFTPTPTYNGYTLLAGNPLVGGALDGTGAAASFSLPAGLAVDGAGNIYVADFGNNTIRKITPAGVVSTLAGATGVIGSADGIGSAASFNGPWGIATDVAGNLYVADWGNNTIRKITTTGVVTTLAGTAGVGGSADGTGTAASFSKPEGVATDTAGNLYVADWGNNTIRKITPTGVVTTLAGTAGVGSSADGTGAAASFSGPEGVTTDAAGNVYVADSFNRTIRKITPAGVVSTLAGAPGVTGNVDGTGSAALFGGPASITADAAGNLYVGDALYNTIRKITPVGVVTTVINPVATNSADPYGLAISGNTLYMTVLSAVMQVVNVP